MDSKIGNFDPSKMTWSRYRQQMKFYLIANKISEELQLPTVLTLIGDYSFNLLCDLIAPLNPENISLTEIYEVLERHFSPKPIARIERYNLRKRFQLEDETVMAYAAELRRLSLNCNLKEKLNFFLSDQFILGLIEADDVLLDKLIEIAASAESTNKNSLAIENKRQPFREVFVIKKNIRPNIVKEFEDCKHCGGKHNFSYCKFKDAVCHCCKKKGHIKTICRFLNKKMKSKEIGRSVHTAKDEDEEEEDEGDKNDFTINTNDIHNEEDEDKNDFIINTNDVHSNTVKGALEPFIFNLVIDDKIIPFELDSGASVSIMPNKIFKKNWPQRDLQPTPIILRAFDHCIKPLGVCTVTVKFNSVVAKQMELFVTDRGIATLCGRPWFKPLGLFLNILNVNPSFSRELLLKKLFKEFEELFSSKLGCIKGYTAQLYLKEGAVPKFCKNRTVPFALLPAIECELNKLELQGILKPIKFTNWAAPIVPILKKNGQLRICGDYKVGLNSNLIVDQYPLPIIDEILVKLGGGKVFTKLDLAQAYQQVQMEEKSAELLAINTHKGLFSVSRLPFGIAPAPAIFQQIMDKILCGIPNTLCYLDDILITSKSENDHIEDIKRVFSALQKAGIRLNFEKCEFFKKQVEYLGHIIDAEGIRPSTTKVKALITAPEPTNVDQLRSFLGLAGYYRKFIPNLASKIVKLNELLNKDAKWNWSSEVAEQFKLVKNLIASSNVLIHYDPKLPIILATDASPWGLGAILSHRLPNGNERPINFASRSLTKAEKNYAQLDKEALAIIFGIKKYHKYIFGRKFTLYTDHKPLTRIFHMNKEIPPLATARLQRWSLILAAYDYDIKYRTSKDNINVDALSRLPIKDTASLEEQTENVMNIDQVENFPWSATDIALETQNDPELSKMAHFIKNGWPKTKNNPFPEYKLKPEQLAIEDGCILWGLRVLVPPSLRSDILKELHKYHTGIVRMKLIARALCWWPKMNEEIEELSRNCERCQMHAKDPPKAPLHPWIRPGSPWERIHIDIMGPFIQKMFLVTVDAFSKWPEVKILEKTDSETVMLALEDYFTRFGYPRHIISDNGTQFTSLAFKKFCQNRGILHTKSAPYHPASNGQAERFVDIVKSLLEKSSNKDKVPLQLHINDLLFKYRTTPHSTLGLTPAEMMFGRKLRTRLERISPLPSLPPVAFKNKFTIGNRVLSKNFSKQKGKERWILGTIQKILGPVTFEVIFDNGAVGKRHMDQLRPSNLPKPCIDTQPTPEVPDDWTHLRASHPTCAPEGTAPAMSPQPFPLDDSEPSGGIRHSTRLKKPPDRLAINYTKEYCGVLKRTRYS